MTKYSDTTGKRSPSRPAPGTESGPTTIAPALTRQAVTLRDLDVALALGHTTDKRMTSDSETAEQARLRRLG